MVGSFGDIRLDAEIEYLRSNIRRPRGLIGLAADLSGADWADADPILAPARQTGDLDPTSPIRRSRNQVS
jgi:hypothetical protein